MGWNGAGTVTLLYDFTTDRDAGAPDHFISADKFDALLGDLASAMDDTLNRNGENAIASNISWAGYNITSLGGLLVNSGGAISFDSGDVTVTHSSGVLSVVGGVLCATNGAAAGATDVFRLVPSDYGTGKPYLVFGTGAAATEWILGMWDGTGHTGYLSLGFDSLRPHGNDVASLGVSGTAFSDLFLASGGQINWNASDVSITHSANLLSFAGGAAGYTFEHSGDYDKGVKVIATAAANAGATLNLDATNLASGKSFYLISAAGSAAVGAGYFALYDATAGEYRWASGTTALFPATSDGLALGKSDRMWSDLWLASGSVVNFNAGDVTLTHGSNSLTLDGGSFGVTGNVAAGSSSDIFVIKPSDYGTGKPGMFFGAHSAGNAMKIALWDGTNNDGSITTFSQWAIQPGVNATHNTQNTAGLALSSAAGVTNQCTLGYDGTTWNLQSWNSIPLQICGQGNKVKFSGIGTTASAANAFIDSGDGNNLLRSTSSLAYKKDVETMVPGTGDAVMQMRPIWYKSKCAADNPDWSFWGFAAEEMALIDPRLVLWGYQDDSYDITEYQTESGGVMRDKKLRADATLVPDAVMYDRLTVMLVDVVQRQEARIAALEAALGAAK